MNTLGDTSSAYPEDGWADRETASADYATRFAGPVGAWFIERQTEGLKTLLPDGGPYRILDVGGGHGQSAAPFLAAGHEVIIQGSHPDCATRLQTLLTHPKAEFLTCSPLELPFPDQAFDWVVCLRLLTHCPDPEALVKELSRVAREGVIVDYPNTISLNAVGPWFFKWKRKVEKNTRHWRSFRHREVESFFRRGGFRVDFRFNQFFFPMAFHRILKSSRLSRFLETASRYSGLVRCLGNPTLIRARREPAQ